MRKKKKKRHTEGREREREILKKIRKILLFNFQGYFFNKYNIQKSIIPNTKKIYGGITLYYIKNKKKKKQL